jgi:hypothetical protein
MDGQWEADMSETRIERVIWQTLLAVLLLAIGAWANMVTEKALKVIAIEQRLAGIEQKLDLLIDAHSLAQKAPK